MNFIGVIIGNDVSMAEEKPAVPSSLADLLLPNVCPEMQLMWNSPKDVASLLLAAAENPHWLQTDVCHMPANGSLLLYRKEMGLIARARDGYMWRKKQHKNGVGSRTRRECHLLLKVNGVECILANYAHSSLLPTFHRRTYFLKHNPDIILFHYLNMPPFTKEDKLCIPMPDLSEDEMLSLTREHVICELRSMFDNFPTKLTKPDGSCGISFDVANLIHVITELVMSWKEGRTPPVVSSEAFFIFNQSSKQMTPHHHQPLNCGVAATHNSCVGLRPSCSPLGTSISATLMESSTSSLVTEMLSPVASATLQAPAPTISDSSPRLRSLLLAKHSDSISQSTTSGSASALSLESLPMCAAVTESLPQLTSLDFDLNDDGLFDFEIEMRDVLPELDLDNISSQLHTSSSCEQDSLLREIETKDMSSSSMCASGEKPIFLLSDIKLVVPAWSYVEGGEPLVLAGNFAEPSECLYAVRFDSSIEVVAVRPQTGLIMCQVPAGLPPGSTLLEVMRDGHLVASTSCHFRTVARPAAAATTNTSTASSVNSGARWFQVEMNHLRLVLLEKLQYLSGCLVEETSTTSLMTTGDVVVQLSDCTDVVEFALVTLLQVLIRRRWCAVPSCSSTPSFRQLSLLHLAAALGYCCLLQGLLSWREASSSCLLELEVNGLGMDGRACTPLSWACALGHSAVADVLHKWQPQAALICNADGRFPIQEAESRGHMAVVAVLQEASTGNRVPRRRLLQSHQLRHQSSLEMVARQPPATRLVKQLSCETLRDNVFARSVEQIAAHQHANCLLHHGNSDSQLLQSDIVSVASSCISTSDEEDLSAMCGVATSGSSNTVGQSQMVTLARQIIQAMPQRNKLCPPVTAPVAASPSAATAAATPASKSADLDACNGLPRIGLTGSRGSFGGSVMSLEDSGSLEEYGRVSDMQRSASLSPMRNSGGGSVPQSLASPYYSFSMDSPPPTTEEIGEHLNAPTTYMEKDFSNLTLSDMEQKRLYHAAHVIQKCFRAYVQEKSHKAEIEAAVMIQSYYRRYKQYAYYKRMCQAAVLIQNQYRTYREQKRAGRSSVAADRLRRNKQSPVMLNQKFRNHYQRKNDSLQAGSSQSLSCAETTCSTNNFSSSSVSASDLVSVVMMEAEIVMAAVTSAALSATTSAL